VFGMGSGVNKTKIVGVTATGALDETGENVIALTYQGGTDHAQVSSLVVKIDDAEVEGFGTTAPDVGDSVTEDYGAARTHLVVIGKFIDGTDQVILDTYMNNPSPDEGG